MKKKYYLPNKESERVTWLNNFSAKLPGYAAAFGITDGDRDKVIAMALLYAYIIGLIEKVDTYKQGLTAFKNTLSFAPSGTTLGEIPELDAGTPPALTEAGIFTFIGGIVQGIKAKKGVYTPAIGEELGIIGEETVFVENDYKPTFKGKSLPGNNEISFEKKGVAGQNIYSHPVGGDQTVWVKIGYDSSSPYNDTRPPATPGTPENREYKGRGVINDVEIGQWSDVLTLTFNP